MDQAFTGAPSEKDHTKVSRYSVFITSEKYFGIEISRIREVLPLPEIKKIPNVSKHVLGIFNLRSTLVPIIDLRSLLGFEQKKKQSSDSDMILLLDNNGFSFGVLVEKVLDFVFVDESKIQLRSADIAEQIAKNISGLYEKPDLGIIYLLDINRLINSNELF